MGSKKKASTIKNTEVKLLLNEEAVLEEGFQLTNDFKRRFDISSQSAQMKIWYLDTSGQDLNSEKWLVRYRYHEDYDLELTYKKRYSEGEYQRIADTDKGKKLLKKAIAEVDMELDQNIYSFSFIERFPIKERHKELDLDEAKKLSIKRCPAVLENWMKRNWGFRHLKDAVLYGPIAAMEYKGNYDGIPINVEIWRLDGYFPELSFDVGSDKAEKKQEKVKRVLEQNGWLKRASILKTDLLFAHFAEHSHLQ